MLFKRWAAPPVNRWPGMYSGFHAKNVAQTSRALTKKVRVEGSYAGGQKFVAPVMSGQVTAPFSSGRLPGSSIGRPSPSTSFAHVVVTKGFATITFPVVRSSV